MSDGAAVVLYEDSRAPTNRFGPHEFVMACVADRFVGTPRHDLERIVACMPMNGAAKVIKAVRFGHQRLARSGESLIVVLDSDRIARHLGLEGGACKARLRAGLISGIESSAVTPQCVFLERNTEDLVRIVAAVIDCAPGHIDEACDRKNLNARDTILTRAAKVGAITGASDRSAILEKHPSTARLVRLIVEAVQVRRGSPKP